METISNIIFKLIDGLISFTISASITFTQAFLTFVEFLIGLDHLLILNLTIAAVASAFTIFFSWRRVGYKVGAIYSWQMNRITASGISSVTLLNYKDRPIPLFSLDAILDGRSLNLKKFEPPLILKPLEVITVKIEPASAYYDENGIIDLNSKTTNQFQAEIYISTTDKNIKCIPKGPCEHGAIIDKRKLGKITKGTHRYCGHIISDKILYAVHYMDGEKHEVSFIDNGGFINWGIFPNAIRLSDFKDIKEIEDTLKKSQAGKVYKNINIVEIEY